MIQAMSCRSTGSGVTALTLGVVASLSAMLVSCDDSGTTPAAAEYFLYAGVSASLPEEPAGYVAVIDCNSDTVVGRVEGGFGSDVRVVASPDGHYFTTTSTLSHPVTIVWDARTHGKLAVLTSTRGGVPEFVSDAGYLVKPEIARTLFYRLSDFQLDADFNVELDDVRWIRKSGRLIGISKRYTLEGELDRGKLTVFDIVQMEVVDSIIVLPDDEGVGLQIARFDISPDGKRLYSLCASSDVPPSLLGYSIEQRCPIFIVPVPRAVGHCRVSPDGREVWVTDPGPGIWYTPAWSGVVFIHDALTGVLIDSISLRGYRPDRDDPLVAVDVRFLPDGRKAYISGGGNVGPPNKGPQPILVVDVKTREVIKLIYDDFDHLAMFIDIGPKP